MHQRERVLQPASEHLVRAARVRHAGRVIVGEVQVAALWRSAALTTSRDCTLAPSMAPRKSSSKARTRWRLSRNRAPNTSCSKGASLGRGAQARPRQAPFAELRPSPAPPDARVRGEAPFGSHDPRGNASGSTPAGCRSGPVPVPSHRQRPSPSHQRRCRASPARGRALDHTSRTDSRPMMVPIVTGVGLFVLPRTQPGRLTARRTGAVGGILIEPLACLLEIPLCQASCRVDLSRLL
jgi:hypothetical protein